MRDDLPKRVYVKHGSYYYVDLHRRWHKLCRVREGLPAMYIALGNLTSAAANLKLMPKVISEWLLSTNFTKLSAGEQRNVRYMCNTIAAGLAEFTAGEIKPKQISDFLKPWREAKRNRQHNRMRSVLQEIFRFAVVEDYRADNPVAHIKTMPEPPRTRYITDSELRRIKVACCYGADGKRTRTGLMMCALIDMAYLTGQRPGDVWDLRWRRQHAVDAKGNEVHPFIAPEGIYCRPSKTQAATGAMVLIEWTPKLRDVVRRLRSFAKQHMRFVFINQEGQPFRYTTVRSAWDRACARAGVHAMLRDIRAKALTDLEEREGLGAANRMGAHSTEAQTADYVRRRKARRVSATK